MGKHVGVLGATVLAVKIGVAALPDGVLWRQVYGLSVLAGEGSALHQQAKLGVLVASLVAAIGGMVILQHGSAGQRSPA